MESLSTGLQVEAREMQMMTIHLILQRFPLGRRRLSYTSSSLWDFQTQADLSRDLPRPLLKDLGKSPIWGWNHISH